MKGGLLMKIKRLLIIAVACFFIFSAVAVAFADDNSAIKAQIEQMQQQINALKEQLNKQQAAAPKAQPVTVEKEKEPMLGFSYGDPVSMRFLGGEVSLYGNADVSFDYVNNGLKNKNVWRGDLGTGAPAQGKMGWMPEISSNLAYFGIRGSRPLLGDKLSAVFQFETEIAYSYTPGGSATSGDPQQKNGIGSRNSYVGLWSPYGAIKIGKTDAPYKTSTAKMDPFDRTLGDYNSIIGNSGGDNRAEFDTRLSHAVWYESPKVYGFNLSFLWSPGQNRGTDNTLEARGESNCTGGNGGPGSPAAGLGAGGSGGGNCTDGSYGDAFSAALTYTNGPLYIVGAGELHRGVNRTSDDPNYDGVDYGPQTGIHNEYALKAGLQYRLALTGTTINLLYEYLKRDRAFYWYNERTRPIATWVAITQELGSPSTVLNLGWAHAGKSPGSPMYTQADGTVADGPVRNTADMWAVGLKHNFDKNTSIYLVGSQMLNARGAHYDLGASGHGTVVDDKDATGHSRMGTKLTAITLGMQYKF